MYWMSDVVSERVVSEWMTVWLSKLMSVLVSKWLSKWVQKKQVHRGASLPNILTFSLQIDKNATLCKTMECFYSAVFGPKLNRPQ